MPEPFPLERAWAHRRKPTPAMFTGRCCLKDGEVRMRTFGSKGRRKDQLKSIQKTARGFFKWL